MPKKRLIFGREDVPQVNATIETRNTGLPIPREVKSDKNALGNSEYQPGTSKAVKVRIPKKER